MVGWRGPCDLSVSPSPFGLDFGTLDIGTSDSGLTIKKVSFPPYYLRVIKIASSDELHAPTHRSCVQNARVRGQTGDNPPIGGQCFWNFDQ